MRKNYNQKRVWLIKSCLVISFLMGSMYQNLHAQIQIQEEDLGTVVYTDNFEGFEGETDPVNWVSSDVLGVATSDWQGRSTGSSTSGGKYSFGASEEDADRSLGFLPSSNRAVYYDLEFQNNSDQTIETLLINYIGKQWRSASGGRDNGWQVYLIYEEEESEISGLNYRGTNTLPTGNIEPTEPLHATQKSGSLTGLEILAGESFSIRFFGDNGTGSGSRQGVAIDDFEISLNVEIEEEDFFTPFTLNTVTLPFTEGFEECETGFPADWNIVSPVQSNPNTEAWLCSDFGQSGSGLRANGFAGGPNELDSWLISPKFAVEQNTFVNFDAERRFNGPDPQFYISSTFDGSEWDADLWDELTVEFPEAATGDDVWSTVSVDLSSYENLDVAIAIRYISSSSGATRITLDDFNIRTLIDIPVSTNEINFAEAIVSGNTSEPQSFIISGIATDEDLIVSATSPFELSATEEGTFENTLSIGSADLATETTVFVRFSPNSGFSGVVEGNINFSINPTVNIALTGLEQGNSISLDYSEDFNDANFFEQPDWQRFQEKGAQNWQITDQTRDETRPFVAVMNGFSGGAQENTTWLISPQVSMVTEDEFILMSYDTRSFFNQAVPSLKLLVSTDYDRFGDPTDESYTWTEINGQFPISTGVWTSTNDINLSAYKNAENLSVAFVYTSNETEGAAEWMVDRFGIVNTNEAPTPFLATNNYALTDYHFGVLEPGTSSESRDISIVGQNFQSDVTFTADAGIELSTDNINFFSTLIVDQGEIANSPEYTLKARMTANAESDVLAQAGGISITTEGIEDQRFGYFNHTTIEKDFTFDVVTWNIEWFGDASNATTSNVQTQLDRVKTMILDLDADVYAFQEITNLEIWNQLVSELEGYAGIVSPEASQGADEFEGAQKLTFLFKTASVDTIKTRALLTGVDVNTDLPEYPGGDPTRFWASGRLPFMMDISTNIDGIEREISLINIHARSNGGGESSGNPRYAMRRYDVEVLHDSLATYYSDKSIILLGDYNDDLDETIADTGAATVPESGESSFFQFMNDSENYKGVTLPLSEAGLRSFIFNDNVIDHVTISNELFSDQIVGAERVVIPYTLIPDYNNTASDHFPVEARFKLVNQQEPVLAITEVAPQQSIEVVYGTSFESLPLPDSVEVTLESNATVKVYVEWIAGDYDGSVPGSSTLNAELFLINGISNPANLLATIEVMVGNDFITELREFSPLVVAFGTPFDNLELPPSTFVSLESGDTTLLNINWSAAGYDASEANTYTLIGEIILIEGISNPDGLNPIIEVTVLEEVVSSNKSSLAKIDMYNYPNPFTSETKIVFETKNRERVKVTVLDMTGRKVAIILNKTISAGKHQIPFSRKHLPAGVYLYRIETAEGVGMNKMMIR